MTPRLFALALPVLLGLSGQGAEARTVQALGPNSGAMTLTGELVDREGGQGQFSITANLASGDFRGSMRLTFKGESLEGPLVVSSSFLENGKCYFKAESGRARATLGGPCNSTEISGTFETFFPSGNLSTGTMRGRIQRGQGATAPTNATPGPAPASGTLPRGRLTCAYQDRRIGVGLGQTTEYSLAYSNMGSLTLDASGTYRTASSSGRFTRSGNTIRLTSGAFAGATGRLEPDRSGEPAVIFDIDDNRRPNGVHIVDPYTTRCTRAR